VSEDQTSWDDSLNFYGEGKLDEALDRMLALESRKPKNPYLLANIGVVYRDSGDLVRAEQYLRRAFSLAPGDSKIRFNLALTLLRGGRLREGFREYECRWRIPEFQKLHREFAQPLWTGEPLNGRRILLYGEQGAGDAIQFVRYAPLVRAAGGEVIVEVLPSLERLMRWMGGKHRVVSALTEGVRFDLHCPLMSLPHRFGTEIDSIPAPARFSIPAPLLAKWAARLRTDRKSVGVVWAGNKDHPNDRDRSIPADCFLPLTRLPGIQCWGLQVGPRTADTPDSAIDLAPELTDFGETAAVISALDLVITVDTAVAHLAGSLGKPVWLLAAHACDWRWMMDREDSPWYPSLRIFRRKYRGEWSDVIERVASEL